jgi:hypothetical protein
MIPRRLNFMRRRFGTSCSFFIGGVTLKMEENVPKRRNIKLRRQGITQKKDYDIQNTAKV